MNSRERVFTALEHNEPDRVPIDFWTSSEAINKLKKHFKVDTEDEVLDIIDVDLRYIEGPAYIGPELKVYPDGSVDDIWGVPRKLVYAGKGEKKGAYKNVTRSPLQDISNIEEAEKYDHWPSVDWYDFSIIEKQCDKYLNEKRIVVFVGDRTNRIAQLKPYMYIRGMENAYIDMALNKNLFKFIVGKIKSFYKEYLTGILESSKGKIDILMTGDDFGAQNSLLCSRKDWLELLYPGFKEYMVLIKQSGAWSMHHTCGSVVDIIKDMAEAGLDILQSLQPGTAGMEPEKLKRDFNDVISFNGGISIQTNLPFGKPEDIKNEVREKIETFAPGGGYIIGTAHNIQADVPLENLLALIEAYKEYSVYEEGGN